jgi:hypothetical protein
MVGLILERRVGPILVCHHPPVAGGLDAVDVMRVP